MSKKTSYYSSAPSGSSYHSSSGDAGDAPKRRAWSDEAEGSQADDASMKDSKDGSADCPLFMDGLPSDFAENAGLAAIAALIDDNEDDESKETPKKKPCQKTVRLKSGGGKVKITCKRNARSPYDKQKNKNDNDDEGRRKATLGEAQLFLNMWKI
ncbi:hypothetical protein ACHAWF_008751 [Thalassiosira exigua]